MRQSPGAKRDLQMSIGIDHGPLDANGGVSNTARMRCETRRQRAGVGSMMMRGHVLAS
jgi:hypothetical protein